jgi:hypothetical protein
MAQEFWPKTPVVLEHEHYGGSKDRGAWGDGSMLLKAVEDYHASYMSIHWWPQIELQENRDLIDRINIRMGYRLHLVEMSWPKIVQIDQSFTVQSKWGNAGVAPCYPGGFMALTLKDSSSGIVSVLVDDALDMRDLQVGSPGRMPIRELKSDFQVGSIAHTTKPGTYDVYISVGTRDGTPVIELPLNQCDGQRRYKIGSVVLTANGKG